MAAQTAAPDGSSKQFMFSDQAQVLTFQELQLSQLHSGVLRVVSSSPAAAAPAGLQKSCGELMDYDACL